MGCCKIDQHTTLLPLQSWPRMQLHWCDCIFSSIAQGRTCVSPGVFADVINISFPRWISTSYIFVSSPCAYNSADMSTLSEVTGSQKRVRKGTHSCVECRRRKRRCIWPSEADKCASCATQGNRCFEQTYRPPSRRK